MKKAILLTIAVIVLVIFVTQTNAQTKSTTIVSSKINSVKITGDAQGKINLLANTSPKFDINNQNIAGYSIIVNPIPTSVWVTVTANLPIWINGTKIPNGVATQVQLDNSTPGVPINFNLYVGEKGSAPPSPDFSNHSILRFTFVTKVL
jgi:hypothetical protein